MWDAPTARAVTATNHSTVRSTREPSVADRPGPPARRARRAWGHENPTGPPGQRHRLGGTRPAWLVRREPAPGDCEHRPSGRESRSAGQPRPRPRAPNRITVV